MSPRIGWSRSEPRLQLAWDATSLRLFVGCPRRYYLAVVEGWRSPKESDAVVFGRLFHEAIGLWRWWLAEGATLEGAMTRALEAALDGSWGWESDDTRRTRRTLVRTLVWVMDQYPEELTVVRDSRGQPAVEMLWRRELELAAWTGESFELCGWFDAMVCWGGRVWPLECKTTVNTLNKSYLARFDPDLQIDLYVLGAREVWGEEVGGVMVEAVQTAVGFCRVVRPLIRQTPVRVEQTVEMARWWVRLAERCAQAGLWPRNTGACRVPGRQCPFARVCFLAERTRGRVLEADFERRPWNPLAPAWQTKSGNGEGN